MGGQCLLQGWPCPVGPSCVDVLGSPPYKTLLGPRVLRKASWCSQGLLLCLRDARGAFWGVWGGRGAAGLAVQASQALAIQTLLASLVWVSHLWQCFSIGFNKGRRG